MQSGCLMAMSVLIAIGLKKEISNVGFNSLMFFLYNSMWLRSFPRGKKQVVGKHISLSIYFHKPIDTVIPYRNANDRHNAVKK